ncbi:hypothetical protein Tdes44962_MAKER06990 [Teratosphaeria destructans]|uniref:Cyanovirin-N domain-containing protein n=1 Tax=Teratosphaeria destructans TaxID=418781 RepID=A0A9W7T0Y3_9PEZI|nr:hypothetical protein Tdes44962_MAKER06990 [Teratosphaeria destructans]
MRSWIAAVSLLLFNTAVLGEEKERWWLRCKCMSANPHGVADGIEYDASTFTVCGKYTDDHDGWLDIPWGLKWEVKDGWCQEKSGNSRGNIKGNDWWERCTLMGARSGLCIDEVK